MYRSNRMTNRIRQLRRRMPESLIATSSERDLHNNSLDESLSFDLDINLNVLDFMPNQQNTQILNRHLVWPKITFSGTLVKRLLYILSLLVVLYMVSTYCWSCLNSIGIFKESNDVPLIKNCPCLGNNKFIATDIYSKLDHLNEKLQSLSQALEETIKWKNEMTITKNNDIPPENFKLLEQMNLKIENALNVYDADKVGMIDYALESAGGFITSIPDTVPYPDRFSYDILGIIIVSYSSNPRAVIQPGTLPGQCFTFVGHSGRIRIRLARIVAIMAVTIEHAHPNLLSDPSSALKDFKVYGLEKEDSETGIELGHFQYKLDGKPLQTFQIQRNNGTYQNVELHILTNHGNLNFTCIYRFRVHGKELN